MRPDVVLRYMGLILLANAAFLLLSAAVSVFYGEPAFRALLYSALVAALFGVFPMIFVPATSSISGDEGLVIVGGGWILSCLCGVLPYVLWGGEFTFTNAWFESVSGYTTTGSSILTNVEALPHGLLFWRASTHFLGGVGIIILVLSVLPAVGVAAMVLYRAEMSPLAQDSFRLNLRGTLRIILMVYVGLTLAETVALCIAGMSVFDAVTHAFATIATGGFSTRNASIASYHSVAIEVIVIVFMILSGMHFGLLFRAIFERKNPLWKSSVTRYYVGALAGGILIATLINHGSRYADWLDALRYSAFQVASIGTSTGFATADSSVWPPLVQLLLMLFALQCACAGSTSGGIKADRVLLFAKATGRQLRLLRHPRAIIRVFIDGKGVDDSAVAAALLYTGIYLLVVLVAGVLLTALGVDMLAAFSGATAAAGNVGPGLGAVGSLGNFAAIPALGKWILSATMLLGRLEIYGLLLVIIPRVWPRR
jgi:trk system potassium uptake protein TrkH